MNRALGAAAASGAARKIPSGAEIPDAFGRGELREARKQGWMRKWRKLSLSLCATLIATIPRPTADQYYTRPYLMSACSAERGVDLRRTEFSDPTLVLGPPQKWKN
jgi:hypothetical protein